MTLDWEKYGKERVFFFDEEVSDLLIELLQKYNSSSRRFSFVDIGCGEGKLIYALYKKGLLKNAERIVGVDISFEKIKLLKEYLPFVEAYVCDAQNLNIFDNNSFDVVVSNQVIEHVPNDKKMLKKIYRILKPNGYLYISTVLKKWYGFWVYYEKGKGFKLDPTHVKEYRSKEEFLGLLEEVGFKVKKYNISEIWYPITDLILRVLSKLKIIKLVPDLYEKYKYLRSLRSLKIKIIGYFMIEVVAKSIKKTW